MPMRRTAGIVRPLAMLLATLMVVAVALSPGARDRWVAEAASGSAAPVDGRGAARHAIEQVIARQIEAFRRGDAPAAFALASASIQERFGSPDQFLATVRADYAAVIDPARFEFGTRSPHQRMVVQEVRLTSRLGVLTRAMFIMIPGKDGGWQIDGCRLLPPLDEKPI